MLVNAGKVQIVYPILPHASSLRRSPPSPWHKWSARSAENTAGTGDNSSKTPAGIPCPCLRLIPGAVSSSASAADRRCPAPRNHCACRWPPATPLPPTRSAKACSDRPPRVRVVVGTAGFAPASVGDSAPCAATPPPAAHKAHDGRCPSLPARAAPAWCRKCSSRPSGQTTSHPLPALRG